MEHYNFKNIHIGEMIEKRVAESGIEISRICKFLKCTEEEVETIVQSESLDTAMLLKWSKLLEYDFFRIYTQHLILYAPLSGLENNQKNLKSALPSFRKNIYTKQIIDFVIELINTGKMTRAEIIQHYKIPKTTLYKWIEKYKN